MSEVQLKDQMKIQQIEIDGEFGMGDPELSRQQEETLYQSMFEHQKLMDDSKTFFDPEVIRGGSSNLLWSFIWEWIYLCVL